MPTYEYRCPDGHDFDHFYRSISASLEELPCPVCGKVASRRVSGGAGLLFKGSGFYITDYGKDGKKDQRTTSKAAGGGSEGAAAGAESASSPDAAAKPDAPAKKESAPASPAKDSGTS